MSADTSNTIPHVSAARLAVTNLNGSTSVWARALWLFGLHTLCANASFVVAYYFLPTRFMADSPQTNVGAAVAAVADFWPQFLVTVLINLTWGAVLGTVLNCNRVDGLPTGYVIPICLGVVSGLIAGSNSFAASDLDTYTVRAGLALSYTVGGLEMLGYILMIAATVPFGVYQYRSWWRWSGAWAPTKTMRLRDVRLSRQEGLAFVLGLLLILLGAYRETALFFGLL